MNGIGKVHHRGAERQVDNIALRRENKHLVYGNIRFYGVNYVLNVVQLLLLLKKLTNPRQTLLKLVFALYSCLIFPVRRDTVFSRVVHIPCAYLNFKGYALAVDTGGVQGLVHILLRRGNIVLEPVRNGAEQIVHYAKHIIAIINRVYDYAHGVNIIDFLHGFTLLVNFAIYSVNALYAPHKIKLAVFLAQALVYFILYVVEELLLLVLLHFHAAFNVVIAHRVEHPNTAILKLLHNRSDTESVRQRSIDFHGFMGYAALLLHRLCVDGTHIVQTIGKLYYDYANVLCHCHEHFAYILRLLLLLGGVVDLFYLLQLGNAVNQICNVRAKFLFDFLKGNIGVLHNVVQKRRYHRIRIHAKLDGYLCCFNRVDDIWFPACAELTGMGFFGKKICLLNAFHIVALARVYHLFKLFKVFGHIFSPPFIFIFLSHIFSGSVLRTQLAEYF